MSRRARIVLGAVVVGAVLTAAGVAVAESGGTALSPSTATRQWAAANSDQFAQGVTTLLRDARTVRTSIGEVDAAGTVRTDCLYLYTDAQGENTDLLPTPDHQLTELLSSSYQGFVQASAVCDEHSASPAALTGVRAEVDRSVTKLIDAVLREEAVTGSSLGISGIP